jgi:hypothetical protein
MASFQVVKCWIAFIFGMYLVVTGAGFLGIGGATVGKFSLPGGLELTMGICMVIGGFLLGWWGWNRI